MHEASPSTSLGYLNKSTPLTFIHESNEVPTPETLTMIRSDDTRGGLLNHIASDLPPRLRTTSGVTPSHLVACPFQAMATTTAPVAHQSAAFPPADLARVLPVATTEDEACTARLRQWAAMAGPTAMDLSRAARTAAGLRSSSSSNTGRPLRTRRCGRLLTTNPIREAGGRGAIRTDRAMRRGVDGDVSITLSFITADIEMALTVLRAFMGTHSVRAKGAERHQQRDARQSFMAASWDIGCFGFYVYVRRSVVFDFIIIWH